MEEAKQIESRVETVEDREVRRCDGMLLEVVSKQLSHVILPCNGRRSYMPGVKDGAFLV